MKSKNVRWGLGIFVFIILANTHTGSWILGMMTWTDTFMGRPRQYLFVTEDYRFHVYLQDDLSRVKASFDEYQKTQHQKVVLYRTFAKNPLYFWKWRSYLWDEKYEYPYKELPLGVRF
ncbi:hypothetical protein [Runella limosa]|uniref:hypothetical protein n=1 Tax=Runella limosa TaxID=370978 RepID=UPI0004164BEB|nr:hypothetical protein [Runella limosa]MCA0228913.1 hypothetical protein [Bacteroidota bacterium]